MSILYPSDRIKLLVEPAEGKPFGFEVEQFPITLGRSQQSQLMVTDRFLSRKHARIFLRDDELFIEDMGSRNGTMLNGILINQARPIDHGDVIEFSNSKISLEWTVEEGQEEPTDELEHSILRSAADLLESFSPEQLQEQNEAALRKVAQRLQVLNEVHEALASPMEQDALLHLILDRVLFHLQPEKGTIFLKTSNGAFFAAASPPSDE